MLEWWSDAAVAITRQWVVSWLWKVLTAATWNVATLTPNVRQAELWETLWRPRVDISGEQEHRWKGCLTSNWIASLRARTASSSSSTLHKSWLLEELAYCWHRAGQTKLLKSSASLTGSSFSSWSSARQFSPSSLTDRWSETNIPPNNFVGYNKKQTQTRWVDGTPTTEVTPVTIW